MDKPTEEEKKTISEFKRIICYKRRYSKWWQNHLDNVLLDLLGQINPKKIDSLQFVTLKGQRIERFKYYIN